MAMCVRMIRIITTRRWIDSVDKGVDLWDFYELTNIDHSCLVVGDCFDLTLLSIVSSELF